MSKMIKCKDCGKEISKKAESCPHCGAKIVKTSRLTWLILILILIFGYNSMTKPEIVNDKPKKSDKERMTEIYQADAEKYTNHKSFSELSKEKQAYIFNNMSELQKKKLSEDILRNDYRTKNLK